MRNKSKLCDKNHNTEIKNRRLMMKLCDEKNQTYEIC